MKPTHSTLRDSDKMPSMTTDEKEPHPNLAGKNMKLNNKEIQLLEYLNQNKGFHTSSKIARIFNEKLENTKHRLQILRTFGFIRAEMAKGYSSLEDGDKQWYSKEELDQAITATREEVSKPNKQVIEKAATKLRALRLTDVGGRKEHPAETVKSVFQRGLGGMYDDESITYVLQFGVKYYLEELSKYSPKQKGEGQHEQ